MITKTMQIGIIGGLLSVFACTGCRTPESVTEQTEGMFGMVNGHFHPFTRMVADIPRLDYGATEVIDDGSGYEYIMTNKKVKDSESKFYKVRFEEYNHPCYLSVDKMKDIINKFHRKLEAEGYHDVDWYMTDGSAAGLVKALSQTAPREWVEVKRREKKGAGRVLSEGVAFASGHNRTQYVTKEQVKNKPHYINVCCIKKGNDYTKRFFYRRWDGATLKAAPIVEAAPETAVRFWFVRNYPYEDSVFIDIPID